MKRIFVQYQDLWFRWKPYGQFHNELNAYTIAKSRANSTGKRFRLIDQQDNLIDLIEPN